MTEKELRALIAGGHQPETFIWRVDFDDDRPCEWAVVADDQDMTNDDGTRRHFAKLAEVTILLLKMGVTKLHYQGAETKINIVEAVEGEYQEIDGLTDEAIKESMVRAGLKPEDDAEKG